MNPPVTQQNPVALIADVVRAACVAGADKATGADPEFAEGCLMVALSDLIRHVCGREPTDQDWAIVFSK